MKDFYVSFLQKYLDFFTAFLKILPQFLEDYLEGEKTRNSFLYLVHPKIAVVSCYHELFDLAKFIMSGENNGGKVHNNLYKQNSFEYLEMQSPWGIKVKSQKNYYNQLLNFINYFGRNKGFDLILKTIVAKKYFFTKIS